MESYIVGVVETLYRIRVIMAGIDKTYVRNVQDYLDLVSWAKDKEFKCPNGQVIRPSDYIYEWNISELEDVLSRYGEYPVMNTPYALDYFLIKHCPLDFVRKRMEEVYNQNHIESVKNGTSRFDTFKREPFKKIKVIKESSLRKADFLIRSKRRHLDWIEVIHPVRGMFFSYNEDDDLWVIPTHELGYGCSNVCHKKVCSKRAMMRLIRKWKLPKGCEVHWKGCYVGDTIIFKTY